MLAKDKAGGRIQTVGLGEDCQVELGAQWIHGEQNEFYDLVKNTGNIHSKLSWEAKGEKLYTIQTCNR